MDINLKENCVEKVIYYLRKCQWISLISSSFSLLVSIILILIFRQEIWELDELSGGIAWLSLILSIYSILFSVIATVALIIYYRIKKLIIWPFIRKESMLLILTIGLLLIYALISSLIREQT